MRRGPLAAAILAVAAGGCFSDPGPGQLTGTMQGTTGPASTSTSGAPTTTGQSTGSTSGGTTAGPADPGITFRLSSLTFIDPHFFLTEGGGGDTGTTGEPVSCNDATQGLNTLLNADIAAGKFSLVIRFEELMPGAEMRLFEGDCTAPGAGAMWTCMKKEGALQTIFETTRVDTAPCRDIDPAVFQAANVADLVEPPPPCVRTEKLDFSVAINDAAGALFLREAQMVASPDSLTTPATIPFGVLYGFLPKASAEDIMVEIPLNPIASLWAVIDVPQCEATHPDQVPSVEILDLGGTLVPGVWLGINFTAERVIFMP